MRLHCLIKAVAPQVAAGVVFLDDDRLGELALDDERTLHDYALTSDSMLYLLPLIGRVSAESSVATHRSSYSQMIRAMENGQGIADIIRDSH